MNEVSPLDHARRSRMSDDNHDAVRAKSDAYYDALRKSLNQNRDRANVLALVRRARKGLKRFENSLILADQVTPELLLEAINNARAAMMLWDAHPDSKIDG